MNIYLVVEGPVGEKQIYSSWVPLVNSNLTLVSSIGEITENNLIIYSGGGYPNYFDVIEAGVFDVSDNDNIDRLVVAVDSEDMEYQEKRNEIDDFIQSLGIDIDYRIIVQHFCLETWGLGNRVIVSRHPKDHTLREYIAKYNVLTDDPELLPDYPPQSLNRQQFSEKYLRKLLNEKYRNLTYSKSNPSVLCDPKYFERVLARFNDTGHISSFSDFLNAFV